jgi:hypothetical protein
VFALLDGGAHINKVSGDHTSPLLIATMNGHFDLAVELLKRGADPNLARDGGATPLSVAIKRRRSRCRRVWGRRTITSALGVEDRRVLDQLPPRNPSGGRDVHRLIREVVDQRPKRVAPLQVTFQLTFQAARRRQVTFRVTSRWQNPKTAVNGRKNLKKQEGRKRMIWRALVEFRPVLAILSMRIYGLPLSPPVRNIRIP